jgi:surface antigen
MMRKYMVAVLLTLSFLTACASFPPPKKEVGMVTGAVLGGEIGHQVGQDSGQTVATSSGAALGAFLGSRVRAGMDRSDQLKTAQALETSKDGQATSWLNPDTGRHYSVMPTRTYQGASGLCREFTTVMEVRDGRRELVNGTACGQPDGTWRTA